jgi:hypothetical protein
LFIRQRSEQYTTVSQFFSHFLRQANGLRHTGHIFVGKCAFWTPFTADPVAGSRK